MRDFTVSNIGLTCFEEPEVEAEAYFARLEGAVGCKLPADYREFFLACGTATTYILDHACFFLENGEERSIEVFWGQPRPDSFGIIEYYEITRDHIHRDLLPIGADAGDNLVCLGFQGDFLGKVFFWKRIGLPGQRWDMDLSSTYVVAHSFSDFLSNLRLSAE